MSEVAEGPGWWQASDLKWYPPELHPGYEAPPPSSPEPPTPPAPQSVRQQPADLNFAETQQRPPFPETATPPPPWGGHRRWRPLIAAAVMIAVVILVVAGITGNLLRQPSTTSPPSTATTSPTTAPPVATSALQGLLLSPDEITKQMGATNMTASGPKSPNEMYDYSALVPDKACLPLEGPAQSTVYSGSGWSAMFAQEVSQRDSNGSYPFLVTQVVVSFPSTQGASAFFTGSAQSWPACSDRQFNADAGSFEAVWAVGPISNTDGILSASRKATNVGFNTCQRALTVVNNVAIDVEACAQVPAGAAVNIAQEIAAKVPTK